MFNNSKSRFIGFSDGIFAVILTILVLDIVIPTNRNLLSQSWLKFGYSILIYIAGFSLVSTYWFFHQKLFSSVKHIDGNLIMLNFYFLFFISLMPILTRLIAANPLSHLNNFIYGMVYLIFNIYLWWLFKSVYKRQISTYDWSQSEIIEAKRIIRVVRGTVFVGIIACICSLIWGPLTPLILAFSPAIREIKSRITNK
ncbi:hypothetical protein CPR19088_GLDEOEPO_00229 [Companilactobacillus paralimentarius]